MAGTPRKDGESLNTKNYYMQTPLAELIDWINNLDNWNYSTQNDIIAKATELLEKERRIIVDANIAGMEFIPADPNKYEDDGQDYFTKTFTDESK